MWLLLHADVSTQSIERHCRSSVHAWQNSTWVWIWVWVSTTRVNHSQTSLGSTRKHFVATFMLQYFENKQAFCESSVRDGAESR